MVVIMTLWEGKVAAIKKRLKGIGEGAPYPLPDKDIPLVVGDSFEHWKLFGPSQYIIKMQRFPGTGQ